jgi:hypothetical protein
MTALLQIRQTDTLTTNKSMATRNYLPCCWNLDEILPTIRIFVKY